MYLQVLVLIRGCEVLTSHPHLSAFKIMERILLEHMSKHMEDREMIRYNQHGFNKVKLCLTDPVALYSGKGKTRAVAVSYLDFCKALDTLPHNILDTALEIYGFDT